MGILFWNFFLFNILLISSLLWVITFLGYWTNQVQNNLVSKTQYECGFKNTTTHKINIYLNSYVAIIFLILYEIEFLLLIPIIFNNSITLFLSVNFFIILTAILITFFLDVLLDSVLWDY